MVWITEEEMDYRTVLLLALALKLMLITYLNQKHVHISYMYWMVGLLIVIDI